MQELTEAVNHLASSYHDEKGSGGRKHRLIIALHPSLKPPPSPRSAAREITTEIATDNSPKEP